MSIEDADRPRVLVLNHFAARTDGAGGTRHVELFGRLRRWRPRIIAADRNMLTRTKTRSEGIYTTVWTLPYRGNGPARFLNWLSYACTALVAGSFAKRPAVVYASSPHLLAGAAGLAIAKLRRARLIIEIRDPWPQVLADMGAMDEHALLFRAAASLERFLYRHADATVSVSEGLRDLLIERGARADRAFVIPNGADPEDFVAPAARDALRARYGLQGCVMAYTGAHGPANGLDLLLDAAATVARVAPDVTMLLVGDGPSKVSLVERVRAEGLANVRFLDPVPKHEMPALLGAVDVGLHVLADVPLFGRVSSPNKLFDYMAAGLPVITNVTGHIGAFVEAAHAGIVVDSHGLGRAMTEMANASREQRREWGDAGRSYMSAHGSRTAMARKLEDVLDEVAHG